MKTFFVLLISFTASVAAAEPAKQHATGDASQFEWPPETATFKPGKGAELAQGLCLNCHSADYVSMQPPMPRKFWEGIVKKMKEKYAAPMPEDTAALADYLTHEYGVK
jgi:sulfite dehydrogenase (cytochrome) subunit B